eukprot:TRINITY_DN33771_c0_g1_i2.p3 TRINITY_DN33771_c0_g1~~TRINITY_DN33771_c0_g1_i2.p3  ORF type:complete len:136 (+),score=12.03 TRINITY_DN33771_c0_g1_i2:1052-1459(+)
MLCRVTRGELNIAVVYRANKRPVRTVLLMLQPLVESHILSAASKLARHGHCHHDVLNDDVADRAELLGALRTYAKIRPAVIDASMAAAAQGMSIWALKNALFELLEAYWARAEISASVFEWTLRHRPQTLKAGTA